MTGPDTSPPSPRNSPVESLASVHQRSAGAARYWWLVAALAMIPVSGVFSVHQIFFVRDLTFFFWSRHLWVRHAVFAGLATWWDPHVASGQSSIADALNQLGMPVTLAIQLLPSDVVSFNLWVALPLPVAAIGTFGFLRRRLAAPAAALGAAVFSLGGPTVSMLNAPNLSWSVAMLPWVMWACDAAADTGQVRRARGVALIAVTVALQALSGEPVTLAATAVIALPFVLTAYGARAAILTVVGFAAGAGLSAAQLVPMSEAASAAHRGMLQTPDFWSLHPVTLWEGIAPHLFGDYYQAFLPDLPWMRALNFGRDPLLYSIYIGPIALLLAGAALAGRPRRTIVWGALTGLFVVAALGGYTPVYPLARHLVPALQYFRFPVKYMVPAAFTVAVLAAEGFDAAWAAPVPGGSGRSWAAAKVPAGFLVTAAVIGVAGLAAAALFVASPSTITRLAYRLAVDTHLDDPTAGAALLVRVAPALTARAAVLLLAGCGLLSLMVKGGPRATLGATLLFATVCADLVVTNGSLNPTADASRFAPPAWYTHLAGQSDRLYVGGRVRGFMNTADPDASPTWRIPAEGSAVLGRMELNAELPMAPSGWGVREALSYDLPILWPAEYDRTVRRFERASVAERDAFLRRTGVRWCVVPDSQRRPWRAIAEVPDWSMRVYECHPDATRVFIAGSIQIASDPANEVWQRSGLFDPSLPDTVARLPRMPAPAGRPGTPLPASVRIVQDDPSTVVVEAAMPSAGVVVLRDTDTASWHADVDGTPADMVPANLLYRAVALPPGRHTIRFTYRPRAFIDGLMISGLTLVMLIAAGSGRRTRRGRTLEAGFTLIELLIVLAIIGILVIFALAEFRSARGRGDEAAALQALEAIATAQWQFAMTCGHQHYAATLASLGQPSPVTGEAFLSPDLTSGETIDKSGYTIHMAAKPRDDANLVGCNGAALADGFAATADPDKPGTTGTDYFGVNATRVVYVDSGQTFTGNLQESGAPTHGAEVK